MKAPSIQKTLDSESENWNKLPWRKLEQYVYRTQKRIFRAEQRGNKRAVQRLQKLLMKSRAARLLAGLFGVPDSPEKENKKPFFAKIGK